VLSTDVDFSISENPNFRFYVMAEAQGLLEVTVSDTQDKVFKGALDLGSLGQGGSKP